MTQVELLATGLTEEGLGSMHYQGLLVVAELLGFLHTKVVELRLGREDRLVLLGQT